MIPDFILNDNHIELPKESVEASTDRPDVYIALPGTEQYRQQFLRVKLYSILSFYFLFFDQTDQTSSALPWYGDITLVWGPYALTGVFVTATICGVQSWMKSVHAPTRNQSGAAYAYILHRAVP